MNTWRRRRRRRLGGGGLASRERFFERARKPLHIMGLLPFVGV
jgi:hypothetical protein